MNLLDCIFFKPDSKETKIAFLCRLSKLFVFTLMWLIGDLTFRPSEKTDCDSCC